MKWFRKSARQRQEDAGPREPGTARLREPGTEPEAIGAGRRDAEPGQRGSTGAIVAAGDVVNSSTYSVQSEYAVVLPPEAFTSIPPDAARGGISNVPGGLFVGRAAELALLDEAFAQEGEVVVHAVHGLGGIGKSALAAHWASRRHEPLRWRITADSAAAVRAGLAELARTLKPVLAGLPEDQQAQRAVDWLAGSEEWLLVLDNVEEPADIAAVLERVPRGRVLITTRRAGGWHRRATAVRLGVLEPGDSVGLFVRVLTHDGRRPSDGAAAVCEEVGHLALAVEQAAAYCAQTGTVPSRYLEMLAEFPAAMLAAGAEDTDSDRTVARIWRLTLDRLADTPLSGTILRILAWYAPDRIPRRLLDDLASPPEVAAATGRLLAYNMISDNLDGTLTVHRLVQTVARTPDPTDPHRRAADIDHARHQATRLLADALPDDSEPPANWTRYQEVLPHADALTAKHVPEHDTVETAYVLNRTALFRLRQGAAATALPALLRALVGRERVLGDDHPSTLTCRNDLAAGYASVGDLARAVELSERTLADLERILGPDHPFTLTCLNNLAGSYQAVGDFERATPLLERALAVHERVLGPEQPRTLLSRNNLASAYASAGDFTRAVDQYERALADLERILGPDHPSTLTCVNNLAHAYQAVGDLERATPLFERALTEHDRVLGPDHPSTLTSRNNLAHAHQVAGDPERAVELHERTQADLVRVLGPDHPDTLVSRNNLAHAYASTGDLARAVDQYERAVADLERILGPDHPSTLTCRNNLAHAYQEAGESERAVELHERTQADLVRVLGPDHPETLLSRNNLAHAYGAAGDLTRAVELHHRTCAGMERVLGPDHPRTRTSRDNLAGLAVLLTRRGHTLLPQDPAGAWRDASAVVRALGPHLTDAPLLFGPFLARGYLLAAAALDADGQPEAAREYRRRAANTA
ncbi:FxSxx-COOH system tetratricopeptide repeat protein [Streptomyces sp. TLI_171]|uniref:FxSxx-COOH system tetratricopeptide repeat protein n=1 Tax=Streptomyces sp. TLI_171 TaxID=1938859 RepID=UPI000C5BF4CA|nr:FxSxx-COOH system tetratricopeptide repeat protein [Streptomyces sp. TLI_171]RKE23519.1 tetratricopeptide (TPR) repeat protein [Streptomyces sp. TLI_171]